MDLSLAFTKDGAIGVSLGTTSPKDSIWVAGGLGAPAILGLSYFWYFCGVWAQFFEDYLLDFSFGKLERQLSWNGGLRKANLRRWYIFFLED